MYLFLDSSLFIQVGILDESLKWVHHEIVNNKKGSQVLHSIIYSCLEDQNIKVADLKGLFLANGPGSYTGIRVAEGIGQILELDNLPVFSFYHFEVPSFCDIEDYSFFAEAFKGEIFHFTYKQGKEDFKLIKEKDFNLLDLSNDHQFHLEGEVLGRELDRLYDLFPAHSQKIFTKVLERGKHLPPYYFRPEDKEFNLPKSR